MKGDFSRITHRPGNPYSRVMKQQGRVQLDSDWNEQAAILSGLIRDLRRDVFGMGAGPDLDCGFRIVTSETQGGLASPDKEAVAAFLGNEQLAIDDLLILPGRYYVGGLAVALERIDRLRMQAGFPFDGDKQHKLNAGTWLAYLDAWEDYVCADQDPAIREVALDGVDTCGRAKVRWIVRVMPSPGQAGADLNAPGGAKGMAVVEAKKDETKDELCTIAPDARYRGAENQLYRIEIHEGSGPDGTGGTFKWSRDNGSVVFPILGMTDQMVTLRHLGRDDRSGLVEKDWVEVCDEASAQWPGVGQLARVEKVDRDEFRVLLGLPQGTNLEAADANAADKRRLVLRRWDHRGELAASGGAIPIGAGEVELEDGIRVRFRPGILRPGDFWYAPARVATGNIDWPRPQGSDGFRPPDGPRHVFAPLARRSSNQVKDQRCRIARLPCLT